MDNDIKKQLVENLRRFLTTDRGLKSHQLVILDKICAFLSAEKGECISPFNHNNTDLKSDDFFEIISATGTGKTRTFGAMAVGMANGLNREKAALIVTPRKLLNEQTINQFVQKLGVSRKDIGIYDSSQTKKECAEAINKKFLIVTYQGLPRLIDNERVSPDPASENFRPIIILDEAHKARSLERTKAIEPFLQTSVVAGFTATDGGVAERLFKNQKPIFELDLPKAVENGLLCDGVRTGVIDVAIDADWVAEFIKHEQKNKTTNYSDELIEKFSQEPAIIQGSVDFHFSHEDKDMGESMAYPLSFTLLV